MNQVWPIVPIRTVYSGLFDGPHATPKPSEEGPVFLGIGNITEDGHLDLAQIKRISEHDFPRWTKRVLPQPGDIVFTYEATLNRYAIVPNGFLGCLGRRLALIRPNPEAVDTRWLHYYFFGPEWRAVVAANTLSGATVDRIPLSSFPDFPIRLPDLRTQRRIASILSAYDDLIDNNTRRIAILEEMARRIYEEWFVRFRFPGHELAKMVDSELGLIPEGWIASYSSHVDFLEGPGLRNWQYRDSGIPFLNIRTLVGNDIDLSKVQYLDQQEVQQRYQHFLLAPYDHVVSSSGTLGRTVTIQSCHLPLMLNTSIIRMRPKSDKLGRWLLKSFIRSSYFQNQIHAVAIGAAQKNYGPSHLKGIWVIAPDEATAKLFEEKVGPMEELILALVRKNNNLRATRDLLLPKLISGELDVSTLPEPVEALAA